MSCLAISGESSFGPGGRAYHRLELLSLPSHSSPQRLHNDSCIYLRGQQARGYDLYTVHRRGRLIVIRRLRRGGSEKRALKVSLLEAVFRILAPCLGSRSKIKSGHNCPNPGFLSAQTNLSK